MPRYHDDTTDSWSALLRDALIRLVGLGLVVGGVLWWLHVPVRKLWAQGQATWSHSMAIAHRATPAPTADPTEAPAPASAPTEPPTEAPTRVAVRPVSLVPTAPPVVTPRAPAPAIARHSKGGVQWAARAVQGVPVQIVTVDLQDPSVVGTLVLANKAEHPNTAEKTAGDEPFDTIVARTHAAVAINGTFFSKDEQKRVMGNMVRDGTLVKFSQWDHDGTTFWLDANNRPGMITAKSEGPPPWDRAWLAMSCGPRLLRKGYPWLQPAEEGFKDSHVLGVAGRTALGFDASGHHLYLVSFESGVDLAKEATIMHALGCTEAMNLDGGASRSLALGSRVIVPAGRSLTNVLAFYDRKHPAPKALLGAFMRFR